MSSVLVFMACGESSQTRTCTSINPCLMLKPELCFPEWNNNPVNCYLFVFSLYLSNPCFIGDAGVCPSGQWVSSHPGTGRTNPTAQLLCIYMSLQRHSLSEFLLLSNFRLTPSSPLSEENSHVVVWVINMDDIIGHSRSVEEQSKPYGDERKIRIFT